MVLIGEEKRVYVRVLIATVDKGSSKIRSPTKTFTVVDEKFQDVVEKIKKVLEK